MLVFDTSAYVNGRRDHYPVATFPSVWKLVGEAMADDRIVTPREVYWSKRMPGICQHVGVDCRTLPEALTMLGARF